LADGELMVDLEKCNHCGRCVKSCPTSAWDAKGAFEVSFGGTFGNAICPGYVPLPLITSEEQLFRVADAALKFFAENGKPKERLKYTIERVGKDVFEACLLEGYNG